MNSENTVLGTTPTLAERAISINDKITRIESLVESINVRVFGPVVVPEIGNMPPEYRSIDDELIRAGNRAELVLKALEVISIKL